MKCHEARQSLAAYIHAEVSRSERELIRAHLAECAACQREFSQLSALQPRLTRTLRGAAGDAQPAAQAWSRLHTTLLARRERAPSLFERMWHAVGGLTFGHLMSSRGTLYLASLLVLVTLVGGISSAGLAGRAGHTAARGSAPPASKAGRHVLIESTDSIDSAIQPTQVRRISGPIEMDGDAGIPSVSPGTQETIHMARRLDPEADSLIEGRETAALKTDEPEAILRPLRS